MEKIIKYIAVFLIVVFLLASPRVSTYAESKFSDRNRLKYASLPLKERTELFHALERVMLDNITLEKEEFEYWKFPLFTFMEKSGDCEDVAILLATILYGLGFQNVFLEIVQYDKQDTLHAQIVVEGHRLLALSGSFKVIDYMHIREALRISVESIPFGFTPVGILPDSLRAFVK